MNIPLLALAATLVLATARSALAFELPARLASLGVFEAILLGLAAYFAVRLIGNLMNRNKDDQEGPHTYDVSPRGPEDQGDGMDRRRAQAQAMWEHFGGTDVQGRGGDLEHPARQNETSNDSPPLPEGAMDQAFDEADFLRGAKAMYVRLRKSWAQRDLGDLAQFTTPTMQARFQAWASGNPDPETFDALLVNANLTELRHENGNSVADVRYEATVSDSPKTSESKTIHEVWRFVRDDADPKSIWKLDDWQTVQ
ncbi:hypothetical protein JCM15519_12770 [Fundidesulfovibrio butyratiphilus]